MVVSEIWADAGLFSGYVTTKKGNVQINTFPFFAHMT